MATQKEQEAAVVTAEAPEEGGLLDKILTEGKMALLISHRFSTVRMADRIVVLADGRVAEHGSHTDLLHRGGEYAEMFELQAASYR